MKTAVVTFAYPAPSIEIYAEACLRSLSSQTDQNFSLFVFNDGWAKLPKILNKGWISAEIVPVSGSPAAIRQQGIRHLAALGFDIIVFIDIDDICDRKRVEVAKKMIANGSDVVVHELVLFGKNFPSQYHMFEGRLQEGMTLTKSDIEHGNCFGMSNTDVRVSAIPDAVYANKNVVAFDWFFYTHVLATNTLATFTIKAATLYRQHDNNIANFRDLTDAAILRGLMIKHQHFEALESDYASEFAITIANVKDGGGRATEYCEAVRVAAPSQPFWWEVIKTYRELGL